MTSDPAIETMNESHDIGAFVDTNLDRRPRAVAADPLATAENPSQTLRPGGREAANGSLSGFHRQPR